MTRLRSLKETEEVDVDIPDIGTEGDQTGQPVWMQDLRKRTIERLTSLPEVSPIFQTVSAIAHQSDPIF
jgi:hypothetical protein